MSCRIFHCSASPRRRKCELVKRARFDGIEVFLALSRNIGKKVEVYRKLTRASGLSMTLHQGWSLTESHNPASQRPFARLGMLPPDGYRIEDIVPSGPESVVLYADRINELGVAGNPRYWFQTSSVCGVDSRFRLSYPLFAQAVIARNLPVVFDTQHVLEYAQGVVGVGALPKNPTKLGDLLMQLWGTLSTYVREIHLQDCNPAFGNKGRSLFTGTGILPLSEFCREVKSSGWDGVVSVEVSSGQLFPYRPKCLVELRETVRKLLG